MLCHRRNKRNTPCRRRRNALRAHRYRLQKGVIHETSTQTDPINEMIKKDENVELPPVTEKKRVLVDYSALMKDTSESETEDQPKIRKQYVPSRAGFLRFLRGKLRRKPDNREPNVGTGEDTPTTGTAPAPPQETSQQPSNSACGRTTGGITPVEVYDNIENSMRLSRLEERNNLTTALRHIVRHLHPKGQSITFGSPEAVDRLELRTVNLPTDPKILFNLIQQVYKRREEEIILEQLYVDFVKSHGRITLDSRKEWPNSHVHTYHA